MAPAPLAFAAEETLGYEASRTRLSLGEAFRLDESYRLCHLPLVAPDHPDVIARHEGRGYAMGRHAEVFSLVAPLDMDEVESWPGWAEMSRELRRGPLAGKIAWRVARRRRARVHATICGGLDVPALPADWREAVRKIGPIHVGIDGLFSGNVNRGRFYLAVRPELQDGVNLFHRVQDALGRPRTALYPAGIHNLADHLDSLESAWLMAWLERWWQARLGVLRLEALILIASHDDLVLDSRVLERIPLV